MSKYTVPDLPRSEIERLAHEWIHGQDKRTILIRHDLDEVPFERLAEELALSDTTVKRLYYAAATRLYEHVLGQRPHKRQE